MSRKDIIKKLVAEGMSEKTLANLNDKQINLLANRMLNEQLKKGSIVMPKATASPAEIDRYTRTGQNVELREKLIGGQTKLDKNKDGELSKIDFEMLRNSSNESEIYEKDDEEDFENNMSNTSGKKQFFNDLKNDPDYIEFKKRTKFDDGKDKGSFGTPSLNNDYFIDKRKYSRVGKDEFGLEDEMESENDFNMGKIYEAKKKPSAGLTAKKKSQVVKAAKAGKDIGKPGKGFEEIEKKAKKAGVKNPKAVAAAAMWKNIKREGELKEDKEIKNWLFNLVESEYHPLTSKGEILSLIKEKLKK